MADVVTFRVVRPYTTEEAFLEAEAWTINTRSVLLIDVEPHPEGMIARIELALANGKALIVAEGSVAKHLAASSSRAGGLVVRFRRMSAASSEFVKRAVAKSADRPVLSSPLVSSPLSSAVAQPPPRKDTIPPSSATAASPASAPVSTPLGHGPKSAPRGHGERGNPVHGANAPQSTAPQVNPRNTSAAPPSRRLSNRPAVRTSLESGTESDLLRRDLVGNERVENGLPAINASRDLVDSGSERLTSHPSNPERSPHDVDAIARLRQRHGAKPISVPPDREAVLARLKKS
ncbi:MAG: hypothetical protein QM784_23310 [Polyangiaceae bacterium]